MIGLDWSTFLGDAASVATVLAAFGGSIVALLYGRKANATVTAIPQLRPDGRVLLAIRPTVAAAGVIRIPIKDPQGSVVHVTEVIEESGYLGTGKAWEAAVQFSSAYIVPGETLTTGLVVDVGILEQRVAGWRVYLVVGASRGGGKSPWDDRIYVPIPKPDQPNPQPQHPSIGAPVAGAEH